MTTPRLAPPLAEPGPHVLTLAVLLLALLQVISVARYAPPEPLPENAPADVFSAGRAVSRIERLLGDGRPHPVGSPANREVGERLIAELQGLGLEPHVQETFQDSERYVSFAWVRNIMARIEGSGGRGDAVLLVAHYDSREAAPGAGDDLAGVASILEVARALLREGRPQRDVILLFTDGEESGLIGADAFIQKHPWFADVGVVLNVEGRGNDGPSLMFETGRDDAALVRRWVRASSRPMGGSLFVTVYEHMPNNTDFTPFKRRGLRGLNFAFIGRVEHYHTAYDDLEHLNRGSVQHHGDNLLGLVRDLAWGPALEPSGDAVFFGLVDFVVVGWPAGASVPLAVVALLLLLYPAWVLARPGKRGEHLLWPGRLRGSELGWGLAATGAILVIGVCASGAVGASIMALSGAPTPFVAHPTPHVVALWAAGVSTLLLLGLAAWRCSFWGTYLATWSGWALLGVLLAATLTGGCYLFVLPSLGAGLVATVQVRLGKESCSTWSTVTALTPLLLGGLVWLPLIYVLPEAMGLGPLAPAGYALAFFLTGGAPLLARRGALVPAPALVALAVALLVALGVAVAQPVHTAEHPRRMNVGFLQDNAKGEAQLLLLTPGKQMPAALGQRLSVAFEGPPRRPFPGARVPAFYAKTEGVDLPSPELAGLRVTPTAEGRRVTFVLRSRRSAREAALMISREAGLVRAVLSGEKVEGADLVGNPYILFWCNALPPGGVLVELTFLGRKTVEAVVLDASDNGLPPAAEPVLRARSPDGVSSYKGDQVIVLDRASF